MLINTRGGRQADVGLCLEGARHKLGCQRIEDVGLLEFDAVQLRTQRLPRDAEQRVVGVADLDEPLPYLTTEQGDKIEISSLFTVN